MTSAVFHALAFLVLALVMIGAPLSRPLFDGVSASLSSEQGELQTLDGRPGPPTGLVGHDPEMFTTSGAIADDVEAPPTAADPQLLTRYAPALREKAHAAL